MVKVKLEHLLSLLTYSDCCTVADILMPQKASVIRVMMCQQMARGYSMFGITWSDTLRMINWANLSCPYYTRLIKIKKFKW